MIPIRGNKINKYALAGLVVAIFLLSSFSIMNNSASSFKPDDLKTTTINADQYEFNISSVLGDNGGEAYSINVDSNGNIIISGITFGNLPTLNADNATYGGNTDGFVTKFSKSGSLLFSTYLGGNSDDEIEAMAVDSAGNIYVSGYTVSPDFQTKNAYNSTYAGNAASDGFVAKYNPSGVLQFSTYFGGASYDDATNLGVDSAGNVYIGGSTLSVDFPTLNAWNATHSAGNDAFLAKLDTNGNLLFSTFVGGSLNEQFNALVVTPQGVFACGQTDSSDFPVSGDAFNSTSSGATDVMITKFNSTGYLTYSSYLGGSFYDSCFNIKADVSGNYYVVGQTGSTNFPTTSDAFNTSFNGGSGDVFYSKFSSTNTLMYSTYYGSIGWDKVTGLALDFNNNVYISGTTTNDSLPLMQPLSTYNGGIYDGFIAKFNSTGSLIFSTYFGGSDIDQCDDIFVDPIYQTIYTAGSTSSTDFSLVDSYSNNLTFGTIYFNKFSTPQIISATTTTTTTSTSTSTSTFTSTQAPPTTSISITSSSSTTSETSGNSPGFTTLTVLFGLMTLFVFISLRRKRNE